MDCYELRVKGRLAESVTALINMRFDKVVTRLEEGPSTTIIAEGLDPSAERALLNLLWDTGHEIISTRSIR
jgi:hypothetical protein